MGGRGESTIVNYGTKVDFSRGICQRYLGQGCELDDVGFAAGGHLSAATVPVALAMSEKNRQRQRILLGRRSRMRRDVPLALGGPPVVGEKGVS